MPQTVITVQAKQSPEIGKKQGKIQDTDGAMWNVWGDKVQNYREGVSYEVTYEEKEFNGHTFNLIVKGNPVNRTPGNYPQEKLPLNTAAYKPQPDGWPGPIPKAQNAMPTNLISKDEMIFVCGILNNTMANPNVTPIEMTVAELIAMTNKARQAWRNTFGKVQSSDDMNDELPDSL